MFEYCLESVILQGRLNGHYVRVKKRLDLHVHGMERCDLVEVCDWELLRGVTQESKSFVAVIVADVLEFSLLGRAADGDPLISKMFHEGVCGFGKHRLPFRRLGVTRDSITVGQALSFSGCFGDVLHDDIF